MAHGCRQLVARLIAFGCAATFLGGCGVAADGPISHSGGGAIKAALALGADGERKVDPSKVHGEIELLTGSSPVEAKLMKELIAGFEKKYPRIKVKFLAINRDYPTVVLTRFSGGGAPDVFVVDGKFFSDWAAKGLLMPLDGYLAGEQVDTTRFHGSLLDSVRGPGGYKYALPMNYSTLALFTNDAMLKQAGITQVPRTWPELEQATRKLASKGNPGSAGKHAGLCLVPNWERMLLFALQQNGGITNAEGTKMKIKAAGTRRAVKWVGRMLDSGAAVSPEVVGASWCGDAFGKQKVAMAIEGAWMLPPMRQFPKVGYSVHQLPAGQRRATLAYSGNISISRTSKNPDAAWLLVDYLASPGAQAKLATAGLGVPSMEGVPFPPALKAFANGVDYATVWSLPPGFFNSVLITADNEMSAMLEGKQTLDGMLNEIDEVGRTMLKGTAAP